MKTSIEWTDMSSNPLRAYHADTGKRGWFCSHASAGCTHCYAERMNRWVGNGLFYRAQNLASVRFEMDVEELRSWQRLKAGTKVFAFDMTDLFQDGVTDEMLHLAFAAMAQAPHVTFQILTKRARRMRDFITAQAWPNPLPNVWLGVSVEDQTNADARIPALLATQAAKRFVSYEPALGPVDFGDFLPDEQIGGVHLETWLDQIIVGGESGPGARGCEVAWVRQAVRQCKAAGVAVFVKQLGARPLVPACRQTHWDFKEAAGFAEVDEKHWRMKLADKKGGDMAEWPEHLRVREFPS